MGKPEKAREVVLHLEEQSLIRYVSPLDIAKTHMELGETDRAFTWLEKACQERDVWVYFLGVDPEVDALRSDARFDHILRRIGLQS
jgi:hypothetical protein